MTKNKICAVILMFAMTTSVSAERDIRKIQWNWIFVVGHMVYNVNQMYWQIAQNAALNEVETPNQDEDELSAEERTCGPVCQYHSIKILENTKQTKNLNWMATVSMAMGFCFNGMAVLMLVRNKESNYQSFEKVSKGISIFSSFLNVAAMSYLIDLELYHRAHEIPIATQGPLDNAVATGVFYFLPSLPVAGYGVAFFSHYLYQLSVMLDGVGKASGTESGTESEIEIP